MNDFQVGPETFVTVTAEVLDAEGESVGEAEVVGFVFGRGALFPGVEQALEGRAAGDRITVRLDPRDAFGQRDPNAILVVGRDEFPPDVQAGDRFEVENEAGGLLVVHVLDVSAEEVHIDTNHPLAGQAITLQVQVLDVRLASDEELAAAEEELEEARALDEANPAEPPLISPQSLIRSRS